MKKTRGQKNKEKLKEYRQKYNQENKEKNKGTKTRIQRKNKEELSRKKR